MFDALVEMAANKVDLASLKRYKNLKSIILKNMIEVITECKEPVLKMIADLVESEEAFININHPAFNRSTEFTQDELAKIYPAGHPDHKASTELSNESRVKRMTFYAAPGDFLKKKVVSQ